MDVIHYSDSTAFCGVNLTYNTKTRTECDMMWEFGMNNGRRASYTAYIACFIASVTLNCMEALKDIP